MRRPVDGGCHGGNGAITRTPTTGAEVDLARRWRTRATPAKCPPQVAGSPTKNWAILHNRHYGHDLNSEELRSQPASAYPQKPDPSCCIAEDARRA